MRIECLAVAGDAYATLNGTTWTTATLPVPPASASVADVTCVPSGGCFAAGQITELDDDQLPVVERFA